MAMMMTTMTIIIVNKVFSGIRVEWGGGDEPRIDCHSSYLSSDETFERPCEHYGHGVCKPCYIYKVIFPAIIQQHITCK